MIKKIKEYFKNRERQNLLKLIEKYNVKSDENINIVGDKLPFGTDYFRW